MSLFIASYALFSFLQAKISNYGFSFKISSAAANPIPEFPPVITIVFPYRLGKCLLTPPFNLILSKYNIITPNITQTAMITS